MPDVVVVGGGITGVATALALARAGVEVTLLEARDLAAMASGWTLGGVRQSGRDHAEIPLATAAVDIWRTLHEDLEADVEYRQGGNLRLARTEQEVETIRSMVTAQVALGLPLQLVSGHDAVREIAPALAPTVLAASYCATDGHANPIKTVRAFANAARRAGAVIREGLPINRVVLEHGKIVGVETPDGAIPAGCVVLATGLHTSELLAPLGLALPLRSQIVSVLQTVPAAPMFEQVFGVANGDCAGRQELDGRFRVTTGISDWPHPLAGWQPDHLQPSCATVLEMIRRIGAVLPIIHETGVARVWGGLIDLTPDGLPVIDAPEGIDGLVVAAGFSGHGFGIAPIVGLMAAELARGITPSLSLDSFRLARFIDRSAVESELTLHG